MKCVPREEGKDILEEIHKGICGNHASSRTLVSKAFRRAFYWPTALGDAEELVRRCQGCQYFAKQQHVPAYKLVTISEEGKGSRQEVATMVAVTAAATAMSEVPPVPVPAAVDQAAMVEIPDDDAPPPRWGQWESWPAPAPEPAAGVLVMREDGCVMPPRPTHGAEASSSRAGLPASNTTVACPEQERERASASPAYFNEAQAEQALWQEFRDHGTSLNKALNEALRIHTGLAWQIFKVRALIVKFEVFSYCFCIRTFPDSAFSRISFTVDRSLRVELERGITASIS
jgi:hypothetical protein